MIEFVFDIPPSVNKRYKRTGRAVILDEGTRTYQEVVACQFRNRCQWDGPLTPPLRVVVWLMLGPNGMKRRDVDNASKALLDGIACGLQIDDVHIWDLEIHKRPCNGSGPHCRVQVFGKEEAS